MINAGYNPKETNKQIIDIIIFLHVISLLKQYTAIVAKSIANKKTSAKI